VEKTKEVNGVREACSSCLNDRGGQPGPWTARENEKRSGKATWAPVEADVRERDTVERWKRGLKPIILDLFRPRRDQIH